VIFALEIQHGKKIILLKCELYLNVILRSTTHLNKLTFLQIRKNDLLLNEKKLNNREKLFFSPLGH